VFLVVCVYVCVVFNIYNADIVVRSSGRIYCVDVMLGNLRCNVSVNEIFI